jgi:hypothetical protein
VLEKPYRLHNVRNRVIAVTPVEDEGRGKQKQPLPWASALWVLIGLGSFAVFAGTLAPILMATFRPTPEIARVPAPQPSPTLQPTQSPRPVPSVVRRQPAAKSNGAPQTTVTATTSILLPSTNRNQRIAELNTGRANPFTLLKTTATIQERDDANGKSTQRRGIKARLRSSGPVVNRDSAPEPSNPKASTGSTPGFQGGFPTPPVNPPAETVIGMPGATPGSPYTSNPNLEGNEPNIPPNLAPPIGSGGLAALPAPPPFGGSGVMPNQGTLSCKVEVNGIIQSKGQPIAVIKSPDEPYNRSVRIGDRLCKGQVGVRDIAGPDRGQPVVVLEQNGMEFTQPVDTIAGSS